MPIDDKLSSDEQNKILQNAEKDYLNSGNWGTFKERFGEYSMFHHPYMGLANAAGQILFHSITRPPVLTPDQFKSLMEQNSVLKPKGGSITFDKEYELGELSFISEYIPRVIRGKLQNSIWESRIIDQVATTLPILERAIDLPDTDKNENKVGYTRHDLLDLAAFTQAYWIIKTQGTFSDPGQISALKEGKIILNYK
jgi:hypothetical protein